MANEKVDLIDLDSGQGLVEPEIFDMAPANMLANKEASRLRASSSAVLMAAVNGRQVLDNYAETKVAQDQLAQHAAALGAKTAKNRARLEEDLLRGFENNPRALPELVKVTQAKLHEEDMKATDPLHASRELVDTIAQDSFDLKKAEREALAVRNDMYKSISDMIDNQSWMDSITDFAGSLVPWGYNADVADLTEGSIFSSGAEFKDFVNKWKQLDPELQRIYHDTMIEMVKEATGSSVFGIKISESNDAKAADMLLKLLDPGSGKSAQTEAQIQAIIGAVDAGALGIARKSMTAIMRGLKGDVSIPNIAAKTGNTKEAASATASVIKDKTGNAAEVTGMSRGAAMDTAHPVNLEAADPASVDGLSADIIEDLESFRSRVNQTADDLVNDRVFLTERLLGEEEQVKVTQSAIETIKAQAKDKYNTMIQTSDVEILESTDKGMKLRATVRLPGGETEAITMERAFKIDDAGTMVEGLDEINLAKSYVASPTTWAKGELLDSTKGAIRLDSISKGAQAAFTNLHDEAIKGLNKGQMAKVDSVLIAGDEFINPHIPTRGKVFTREELLAGIDTQHGTVKLTSKLEQNAYYKAREVADLHYQMANHGVREKLVRLGMDSTDIQGARQVVKPLESVESAKATVSRNGITRAYDKATNSIVDLTEEAVEKLYEKKGVLARFRDGDYVRLAEDTPGLRANEFVDAVIISADDLKGLPDKVIHHKPGYVPKLNKGVEYLVKHAEPVNKNGRAVNKLSTVRFFASKKQAEQFAAKKNAQLKAEGKQDAFQVVADRELTEEQMLGEAVGSSGGLFNKARAEHEILFGLGGEAPERVSAFEALKRNGELLGNFMSKSAWADFQEQKWLNTVKEVFPTIEIKGFNNTLLPDTNKGKVLARMRQQIQDWSSVRTREETLQEAAIQRLHDWALDLPGLKSKERLASVQYLKHADLPNALKAATFHAFLGTGNVAQVFIQGSQAAVGAARFPKYAPASLKFYSHAALLDNIKNPAAKKAYFDKLRSAKILSSKGVDKLQNMYEAYQRSGLGDSFLTNKDFNALNNSYGTSGGMFEKMSNASQMLVRSGTLFSKRFNYASSYLKLTDNGAKKLTPELERKILEDANLSDFEMTKANAAYWQGGANVPTPVNFLSVSTQFAQFATKTVELMTKGSKSGFTRAEKAKIITAQIGLWGAGGVPLVSAMVDGMLSASGVKSEDLSREQKKAINDGMVSYLALKMFDADVDISSRTSITQGAVDYLSDLVLSDSPMVEKALGSFSSLGGRTFDAIAKVKPLVSAAYRDRELTKDVLFQGLSELGQISSSGRNLWAAHLMHNAHKIIDKSGNTLVERDFSLGTEIGKALGFEASAVQNVRLLEDIGRNRKEVVRDLSNVYVKLYNNYVALGKDPGAAITIMEASMGEKLSSDVRELVWQKILNPTNREERAVQQWLNNTIPNEITNSLEAEYQSWHKELLKTKAIMDPLTDMLQDGEEPIDLE